MQRGRWCGRAALTFEAFCDTTLYVHAVRFGRSTRRLLL